MEKPDPVGNLDRFIARTLVLEGKAWNIESMAVIRGSVCLFIGRDPVTNEPAIIMANTEHKAAWVQPIAPPADLIGTYLGCIEAALGGHPLMNVVAPDDDNPFTNITELDIEVLEESNE